MKTPHILILDDDMAALTALTHVFEKRGMKTTVVREGAEGIRALKKKSFDLVLLDIKLPLSEVDGWEVLKNIKSDEKTSATPVYVLTNAGLEHEIKRGLELGADAYLLKAHTSIHDVAERVAKLFEK